MTSLDAIMLNCTKIINSMKFMIEMSLKCDSLDELGFVDSHNNLIEDTFDNQENIQLFNSYLFNNTPCIRSVILVPKKVYKNVYYISSGYKDPRLELNNKIDFDISSFKFKIEIEEDSNIFFLQKNGNIIKNEYEILDLDDEASVFQYSTLGGIPDIVLGIALDMKKLLHLSPYVNRMVLSGVDTQTDFMLRDMRNEYDSRSSR